MTAHRTIDWVRVFRDGDLVVDCTNSVRGHDVRDRTGPPAGRRLGRTAARPRPLSRPLVTHPRAGRLVHVVGARPNFMKAAPVVRALDVLGVPQVVVHTGQHYDRAMSDVFFEELGIPEPEINLGVGSGSHAAQTAALMTALEPTLLQLDPPLAVVYGDINSTLATAVVASKLGIPLAHVEAGLRSFDMTMPEEVNRRVTDILSDVLFLTSPEAADNLLREGVPADRQHFVGNPMIDTLVANLERFDVAAARAAHGLAGPYAVATLHRPANVDTVEAATKLVGMLEGVAAQLTIVLPLHPRARRRWSGPGCGRATASGSSSRWATCHSCRWSRGATVVVTDSGGIQEETTILGVPCLTVRPNTERPITITHGTNRLLTPEAVPDAVAAVDRDQRLRPRAAAAVGRARRRADRHGSSATGWPRSAPRSGRGRTWPGAPRATATSPVGPGATGRAQPRSIRSAARRSGRESQRIRAARGRSVPRAPPVTVAPPRRARRPWRPGRAARPAA